MEDKAIIVLAAGKGTRMKSKRVKVLHSLGGRPILSHIIESIHPLAQKKVIVVGYQAQEVKRQFSQKGLDFVYQKEQLGTGDAVLACQYLLQDFQGQVMILSGDVPLLRTSTLTSLWDEHKNSGAAATLLTVQMRDADGYGRIIRDKKGVFSAIREHGDATAEERRITEINAGIYCFHKEPLFRALQELDTGNQQGEYYLTDVFSLFLAWGLPCQTKKASDPQEVMGINTRLHLAAAEGVLRQRINEEHLLAGVTILDPGNTYIEKGVTIGADTVVLPFTFLQGETVIGEDCLIGPQVTVVDSSIGDGVLIKNAVLTEAVVESEATIGPFTHLRPGSKVGKGVRVGNFVEVKNSSLGEGSKVSHLTYMGDTQLGPCCNVGAGTVIANYDGKNKHETIIGKGSFLGSNSTLVAPITLGEGSRVGAGAVVTRDVKPKTLVLGVPAREYQEEE